MRIIKSSASKSQLTIQGSSIITTGIIVKFSVSEVDKMYLLLYWLTINKFDSIEEWYRIDSNFQFDNYLFDLCFVHDIQVDKQTFDVFDQAAVSFKFRTFLDNAVLFLVSRSDLLSYIGVYVNNGKVTYEMTTSGNAKYAITSFNKYNDASWYQVKDWNCNYSFWQIVESCMQGCENSALKLNQLLFSPFF